MLQKLYEIMPAPLESLAMSAYGLILYRRRYSGKFREYCRWFRENETLGPNELEELQNKLLRSIISHAYSNVPYYSSLFKNLGLEPGDIKGKCDLKKLPLLTKEIVRSRREEFIARNYHPRCLIKQATGGSAGNPLVMLETKEELQYINAIYEVRVKEWSGVKTGDKLATFLGRHIVPQNMQKPPYWRHNFVINQTYYSVYHLNSKTSGDYYENLKKEKTRVIMGYVAPIFALARYILDEKLAPLETGAVLTTSEVLHDWQRETIEKAFDCRVCDAYSQTEGVCFISECAAGKLHVQPEFGICEFLPYENSGLYEIAGTTLFNYAMPLIRYRTNDLVEPDDLNTCMCGSSLGPIVKRIIGRDDDLIVSGNGCITSSAAVSTAFLKIEHVKEAQLIQKSLSCLEVRLVVDEFYSRKDEALLLELLSEKVGNTLKIGLYYTDNIPRTTGGKYRFIINETGVR